MEVKTDKAPMPIGPYSQAIKKRGFVFCSGQIGLDPNTNSLPEGIRNQTRQALENVKNILGSINMSLKDVVKVTVYLTNKNYFQEMNEEYSKYFSKPFPSRTTVFVSSLPRDALVEIDVLALR